MFVRLTACDLRCSLVRHAVRVPRRAARRRSTTSSRRSSAYGCPLVEITGGEPLLQEDVYPLMERLLGARPHGDARDRRPSSDRSRAGRRCVKIVDVKCPASGEADKNDWDNLDRAGAARRSQVRHPGSRRLRVRARRHRAAPTWPSRAAAVLLSPVHGVLDPKTLSEWCSPIGCRCGCSCSCTSSSGRRRRAASSDRVTPCSAVVAVSERRARFLHRRGDRQGASGFALYALTDRSTASGTRARSRRRARVARALGVARHLELRSICARIGGSSLTSDDRRCRAIAISPPAEHPVDLRAGAQHDLPVARARLGRSARRRATSSSA